VFFFLVFFLGCGVGCCLVLFSFCGCGGFVLVLGSYLLFIGGGGWWGGWFGVCVCVEGVGVFSVFLCLGWGEFGFFVLLGWWLVMFRGFWWVFVLVGVYCILGVVWGFWVFVGGRVWVYGCFWGCGGVVVLLWVVGFGVFVGGLGGGVWLVFVFFGWGGGGGGGVLGFCLGGGGGGGLFFGVVLGCWLVYCGFLCFVGFVGCVWFLCGWFLVRGAKKERQKKMEVDHEGLDAVKEGNLATDRGKCQVLRRRNRGVKGKRTLLI